MTKDKAIESHYNIKCHILESKKLLGLINNIYYDFDMRICKHCKHTSNDGFRFLPCPISWDTEKDIDFNFGCNRWISK